MRTSSCLILLVFPLVACSPAAPFTVAADDEPTDAGSAAQTPDAGDVTVADAGTPPPPPPGVVPSPAPLTEAQCRWELPTASCPNGEPCLLLHRRNQPATPVLTQEQLGQDTFHFMPYVGDDHLYFTTYRSVLGEPGAPRFVALPALGGPLSDVLVAPEEGRINSIEGVAFAPGYGLWFTDEIDVGDSRTRTLRLTFDGSHATVTNPGMPSVRTAAVALGTDYFVAHEDGVYAYYPAGGSRIVETAGVTALAASESAVVFAQCGSQPVECSIRSYGRRTFEVTDVATGLEERVESVVIIGADVFALTARSLFRVPLDGSAEPVRIYAGGELPQHPGTLKPNSLRVDVSGTLFLEQVCHPDADAPEYGTIMLDVDAGTAEWLNARPEFPLHPQVRGRYAWDDRVWVNSTGLYTWQWE